MPPTQADFEVADLGECTFPSPLRDTSFIDATNRVLFRDDLEHVRDHVLRGVEPTSFELAGPRERIFFDPAKLKAAIVTCGGLCPGLNDAVRAIVIGLREKYGVRDVVGLRFGFEGLVERYGDNEIELTSQGVSWIQERGGTVIGTSRGAQSPVDMVDTLERLGIGLLFTIGGDGTLKGAHTIADEVRKRGLAIGVIGVPKTIDNDISFVETSFGFETAVAAARTATRAAYVEASCHRNGIGLVKLMGRDSGFIAGFAAMADACVGACLIPESPFSTEGLVGVIKDLIRRDGHAVVLVAEGAGQDLLAAPEGQDASGNARYGDIGVFLKDRIPPLCRDSGLDVSLKYIDPSYMIRSLPANTRDAAFCQLLGFAAVDAGMAGKTDIVVGLWRRRFTHVPIPLAVSSRKKVNIEGRLWQGVLAATGQPRNMC
ncbi:ATP-dependent 6-phosphofructokinase [Antrihabitans sp. YC2-6]|uniref:ATP-dependent 6-phosphofructokinase n=1 Tax=Antrihabitans sp. YC2-6 TaxID=2799498 RepID=UPI0018F5857B|nr:ATP-dependent 6-phosphofructokinase [Antrihabitans sp. YC2-6]MBJ8348278.1 ATP-dependent 6-phosphofructokinase [Antrihabitans sp. YC2-6]